ncbi:non-pathogenic pore-forming peptide-like [Arapaima gigas]
MFTASGQHEIKPQLTQLQGSCLAPEVSHVTSCQKEVKDKLYEACGKMPHKASCKKFTRAKTDILVEKPSTTDDPKTACVDVGACRTKSTVEDIVLEALRSTKIS